MNRINDKAVFSRPRLIRHGPQSQIVRINYKLPWRKTDSIDCILKLYPQRSSVAYDKEVGIYHLLYATATPFQYAKPLGYAEWTPAKYVKTIGKGIQSILDPNDSTVLVLLL